MKKIIEVQAFQVSLFDSDTTNNTHKVDVLAKDVEQAIKIAQGNRKKKEKADVEYVEYKSIDPRFNLRFYVGYNGKKDSIQIIHKQVK